MIDYFILFIFIYFSIIYFLWIFTFKPLLASQIIYPISILHVTTYYDLCLLPIILLLLLLLDTYIECHLQNFNSKNYRFSIESI